MWNETISSILVLLIFTNKSTSDVYECTTKQCKPITPRAVNGLQYFLNFMQNKNPPRVVHMQFLKPPPVNLNSNWGRPYLMPDGISYRSWPTAQPASSGNIPYLPSGFKPVQSFYDGQHQYQQHSHNQQVSVSRPMFYYVAPAEYGQYGAKNVASQSTQFPYRVELPAGDGQRPSTEVEIIKALSYALPPEITTYHSTDIAKQFLLDIITQPQIKGATVQNVSQDPFINSKLLTTTQKGNFTNPPIAGDMDDQYFQNNTRAITFDSSLYDEEAANHTANSNRTNSTGIIDGSNFLLINNTVPFVSVNINSTSSNNGLSDRTSKFLQKLVNERERSRSTTNNSVQIVEAISAELRENQQYEVTEENDLFAEQSKMRKQTTETAQAEQKNQKSDMTN